MNKRSIRGDPARRIAVRGAWLVAVLLIVAVAAPASAGNYTKTLSNDYHAQSKDNYCGPASIQMMLDSSTVGWLSPGQDDIFAKVGTYNTDNPHWHTDANGLKGAVQFYDPAHTYLTYYYDSYSSANRKLAYNLDKYNVPASVLFYGGVHWVDVRGVWTYNFWQSAKPRDNKNYTIIGFYMRDPWDDWGGLGHNTFLWDLPGGWKTKFKKVTATSAAGSPWTNKYTFVADPDPFDGDLCIPLEPSPLLPDMLTAEEAAMIAQDILYLEDDEGLHPLGDLYGFDIDGGFFSPAEAFTLNWYEDGRTDWIVPFVDPGLAVPDNITGAMIIDAWTGDAYRATWIEENDPAGTVTNLLDMYSYEYGGGIYNTNLVPEPSTLVLLMVGILLLTVSVLRRRR